MGQIKRICKRCSQPAVAQGLCERHVGSTVYRTKNKFRQFELSPRPRKRKTKRKPSPLWTDRRWRRLSKSFLKANPICARCRLGNRVVKAVHADHIRSVRQFPDLIYEESNLQPLCKSCHSYKTMQEGKGRFHDYVRQRTYMPGG